MTDVQTLVGRVAAVDAGCTDCGVLKARVEDLRRLKSWVEGREVAFAQQIAQVSSFPEKSLAEAGRTSLRHGEELLHRAETAQRVPEFGESLDAGKLTGEHVDVLTRTLRSLEPDVRSRLIEQASSLVTVAENASADEFARAVRAEARRLERDGDGLERLERQRRDIRLNTWTEKSTGMGRWSVTWDPATMLTLEGRLDATVEAMFHDAQPEGCPTDLLEKQSYLRAHALLALLNGKAGRPGRPEIIVVEDHTTGASEPVIDWGVDVELPREFLDALRPRANTFTIKVRNGVVIDAPGVLDLGRTTRLANRAQRRALRGLYATLCDPRLLCALQPNQVAPRHLVALPGPDRSRQLAAGV